MQNDTIPTLIFFCLFFALSAHSSEQFLSAYNREQAGYFSRLETVQVKDFQTFAAYFHYNPRSTVIMNERNSELSGEKGADIVNVAEVKIKIEGEERYLIIYDGRTVHGP